MALYAIKKDDGTLVDTFGDTVNESLERSAYFEAEPNKSEAERYARQFGGHMVELVEKPEPVMVSEDEAEMLEQAKRNKYPATLISNNTNDEDRLMRAYVNGWTVEKPKRWNVKVPHTTNSYYYDLGWGNGLETQNMKAGTQPLPGFREAQFTQDEINKRGLQDYERVEVTYDGE